MLKNILRAMIYYVVSIFIKYQLMRISLELLRVITCAFRIMHRLYIEIV